MAGGGHILHTMSEVHEESQRWRSALLEGSLRTLAVLATALSAAVWLSPVPAPWLRLCLPLVAVVAFIASKRRALGFRVRVLCMVGGLHVIWALPLLRAGIVTPNTIAGFFLETVLATLLLQWRAGLWVVLVDTATLGLSFAVQRAGLAPARPDDWFRAFDAAEPSVLLRIATVAAAGSIAAVFGISHLLQRLERAISERDASLVRLEREHAARLQALHDLEQVETDFVRARELEVLGRLSGYVAHDFNNALLAIFGGAELVRQAHNQRDRDEAVAIVQSAASQAASTVKQLRAFGPQAQQEPRPIDPQRVVRSIERMLRTLSPKNVELIVAAQPTAAICMDEGLLQSALMNLALNAWDAMRDGGRLEIRIREQPTEPAADGGEPSARDHAALGFVIIEVRDSGVGMDDTTRARAFAPFYTTKGAHGSGLGLASVRQTVEAAQGTVSVESGVGRGTCVRLCLPAVAQPVSAPQPVLARSAALEGRVLVVDDDQAVRRTVATYLRRCGLTTFEAQTRDEALQLTTGSDVDVVVTDGVVSGTTVASFLHDLRLSAPGMRVVLCSGSAPEAFEAARGLADATLAKPFELESLITSLRPLIARPPRLQAPPA
ncbi:MAG: hypothetical protein RL701_3240 [Pseudomonadota bacterium]